MGWVCTDDDDSSDYKPEYASSHHRPDAVDRKNCLKNGFTNFHMINTMHTSMSKGKLPDIIDLLNAEVAELVDA